MMLREGAQASYVGDEHEGRAIGDRCLVLSADQGASHVRWVTGAKIGTYELVANDDLVADRAPARFADEFSFDSFSGRLVNVACYDVRSKRGDRALLRAIEQEGHLTDIRRVASVLVGQLKEALRVDPSWMEISDDLGDDALGFEAYALREILVQAMKEVDHDGAVPSIEEV